MKRPLELSEWEKGLITHIKRHKNTRNLFTCTVDSVSKSGMTRHIKVGLVYKGEFIPITHLAAKITGWRLTKKGDICLVVGGCGMDMCFATIQNIGAAAVGKGFNSNMQAFQHYRYF